MASPRQYRPCTFCLRATRTRTRSARVHWAQCAHTVQRASWQRQQLRARMAVERAVLLHRHWHAPRTSHYRRGPRHTAVASAHRRTGPRLAGWLRGAADAQLWRAWMRWGATERAPRGPLLRRCSITTRSGASRWGTEALGAADGLRRRLLLHPGAASPRPRLSSPSPSATGVSDDVWRGRLATIQSMLRAVLVSGPLQPGTRPFRQAVARCEWCLCGRAGPLCGRPPACCRCLCFCPGPPDDLLIYRRVKSHCVSTWDRDYSYPDLGACWLSSCHTSCRTLAQPLKAAHRSVRVPTGE
eukprot:COSAG06_NODE_591_length_13958_cov_19.094884_3_plen_299_part_00